MVPPAGKRVNLFVIGAMKCGTTTLYRYFDASPAISVCQLKEPMYFSHDVRWEKGRDWYDSLFDWNEEARWFCDCSTGFTRQPFRPEAAERLHDYNPEAKLIYLVREPKARIFSQYRHMVRLGVEQRGYREALLAEDDYLTTSLYAYQLDFYRQRFTEDQLLVLSFEAFMQDPSACLSKISSWLDTDLKVPEELIGQFHENANPEAVSFVDASVQGRFRLRRSIGWLKHLIGGRAWAGIRRLKNRLLALASRRRVDFNDPVFLAEVEQAHRALAPAFLDSDKVLQRDFGIDTSGWHTAEAHEADDQLTSRFRHRLEAMCSPGYEAAYSWQLPMDQR